MKRLFIVPVLVLLIGCAGMSERQRLAAIEIQAEKAYDEIAFLRQAGALDEAELEDLRAYDEALAAALAAARRAAAKGEPLGASIAGVNQALQALILERQRRESAKP